MEIHSSSLRLPPAGSNRLRVDKPGTVKNNVERDDLKLTDRLNKNSSDSGQRIQTPGEIEQALGQEGLQFFPAPVVNESLTKPFNSRIQQALNAYTEQLNQPILKQRTELILGIDFYV